MSDFLMDETFVKLGKCPHGGIVTIVVPQNTAAKTVNINFIVPNVTLLITGCPNTIPGTPNADPCTTVDFIDATFTQKVSTNNSSIHLKGSTVMTTASVTGAKYQVLFPQSQNKVTAV